MKHTTQYSVGGEIYDIPLDQDEDFRNRAGNRAEKALNYRIGNDTYAIPESQNDAFLASAAKSGKEAVKVESVLMNDGTRRDFSPSEMAKFLRSREYRESEDYAEQRRALDEQIGSSAWAGFKGAVTGAAQGAYAGGKSAMGKVVSAIPETIAGVSEAFGNAINAGGNAENAVGNYFRDAGRGVKQWLDRNIKTRVSDELGYEDWSTRMSEIAGDAAGMAAKFAPATVLGPSYMETIFAADGINAYTRAFEDAKRDYYIDENGNKVAKRAASDAEANVAGAVSGVINYFGSKLLMKGNAATAEINGVLQKALAGIGWDAAVMGGMAVGNRGVQNVIEGKPITEGMAEAGFQGASEGAQFRIMNESSHIRDVRRETKEMRNMRRENLLTVAEQNGGGEFIDKVVGGSAPDGAMREAVRARRKGENVSRKMAKALDLPDNMSADERNEVVDSVIRSRDALAERVRTKMDDVQAQALTEEIGGLVDKDSPEFEKVWLNAVGRIKDAGELNDPQKRMEIAQRAVEDVVLRADKDAAERKAAKQNLRMRKDAKEMAREEENAPEEQPTNFNDGRGENAHLLQQSADQYALEDADGSRNYNEWLKKQGKKDTEANRLDWFQNHYAKVDGSRLTERSTDNPIPEPTAQDEKDFAEKKRIQDEMDADKLKQYKKAVREQREEELRAEKEKREKAAREYEKKEAERKAREAAEESTLQPQEVSVKANGKEDANALPDTPGKAQWPEYKAWLKKNGRDDTAKSWNRFVMENELDPALRVDTKDQKAYSAFRERMEGVAEPESARRFPKDEEAAAKREEKRGADMRMNRDADFRRLKEAGLSDEDAGYYLTYGKEAFYRKRVAEWEERKAKAQKQGKKFDEPKPTQMEFDFSEPAAEPAPSKTDGEVKSAAEKPVRPEPGEEFDAIKAIGDPEYLKKFARKDFVKSAIASENEALKNEIRSKESAARKSKFDELKREISDKEKNGDDLGDYGATLKSSNSVEDFVLKTKSRIAELKAKIADWSSRKYKNGDFRVKFDATADDGEVDSVSSTATHINEKRRANRIAGFESQIEKAEKSIKAVLDAVGIPHSQQKEFIDSIDAEPPKAEGAPKVAKTPNPVKPAPAPDILKGDAKATAEKEIPDEVAKSHKMSREEFRAMLEQDPVIKKLQAQLDKADTEAERGQLQWDAQERVTELRDKYLRSIDNADRMERLRNDADAVAWAKKNGYSAVDGRISPTAVKEYLKNRVMKAKEATKRLFSDAQVEVKDREWNAEMDGDTDNTIRNGEGRVVGTFDPATKKVTLYRGADEKTVYHELIGHGVENWARTEAAKGNEGARELHRKLMRLAEQAPESLKAEIRSRYPDADDATIAKEIIARIAEGRGAEFIKLKDAPKGWVAKTYATVRDAVIGFMEKLGLRNIDLSRLDDMTPTEAMDHLMKEIAKGKTLGKIGAEDRMGIGEKWANAMYDRHTSLGKISKEAADAKAIQPGKEFDFEVHKFQSKKDGFTDLLKQNDISVNEVDEYMKTIAAPERNAADGWESSGWDAKRIAEEQAHFDDLRRTDPERFNAIKRAADYLWKMQDEGMKERVRSGLVSQSEYDEWKSREEHHIPFRSAIDENGDLIPWGKGISGNEFEHHEGRYSESGSPSAFMFEEYANAHLRAIENDARKVLADAVRANPRIGTIETMPSLRESRMRGDGGNENVVSFKTVNADGRSVTHHIVLSGERGAAAASSYTNRNLHNKNPLIRKTQAFMRFWSATATEWSPTFALRNTFADNTDLATVVLTERGAKEGGKWIKDYGKNRWSIKKDVWDFARNGRVAEGSILDQYIKEGGMIGGFQREGYADMTKQFSADAITKEMSRGANRHKAIARYTIDAVKALNSYAELMTRVAAFKTNVDRGMSAKDAAIWSRRVSVDFNRKGNLTPITNTLFMFSNSTIGATMRQLEAVGTGWKTPQGRRALVGLAAFGMTEAVLEHFLNADDEERGKRGEATGKDVNEHTRKTSLYLRFGDKVFRAPVHEDPLMKLVYVANATTRLALGDMKAKDYAIEVGAGMLEELPRFAGMGSKTFEAGFNTWMPTALQPVIQGLENKDYAGRPIYRPKYDEALPDSQNGRKSTATEYKWVAETMNAVTGGSKWRSGALDVAPETVKLVTESTFKNIGKDLANAADVGINILTGNFGNLDSRRTPVVRDLMRRSEGNDNRYFEAMRRFDSDKHELTKRTNAQSWESGERKAYLDAHPHLKKNGMKNTRIERLVNGYATESGRVVGINDLRRMEGGEKRVKTAMGWKWKPFEWSDEQIQSFRARRFEKQAKVLEIMGD